MSELKPCPFCGKKPNPNWTDESYIECTNRKCSVYGYGMSTGDWNTRPIEDALNARIAELEAENYHLQFWLVSAGEEIDQLTAHSDIERQDDKSSNDTQTRIIVYGKERER